MNKWLLLGWLMLPLSFAFARTPCDGVDRDLGLTPQQVEILKANIGSQVNSKNIDILNVFKEQNWSVIVIDSHNADETFLFFAGDALTERFKTQWSGAATIFEGTELTEQFIREAPGIPVHLATCIAWKIAVQGKLPGVYSNMKVVTPSYEIVGDEMMFGLATDKDNNYWVVFQHAANAGTQPVVVPVKVDASTGHFTFRLTGEMAAWGGISR